MILQLMQMLKKTMLSELNCLLKAEMRLFGNIFLFKLVERFTEDVVNNYPLEYFERSNALAYGEIISINLKFLYPNGLL